METVPCYQCGSSKHKLVFRDGDTVCTIAKCRSCGAYYTRDRYIFAKLRKLYEQESFFEERNVASCSSDWLPAWYNELKIIESIQRRRGDLLDVGCGGGALVYTAHQLGWRAFGIEVSKAAVDSGRDRWGLDTILHTDLDSFESRSQFDVITAYHVLEHLYHPKSGLKKIYDLLKPDGLLVVQVPNFGSLDLQLDTDIWNRRVDLPYHTVHFTPSSLCLFLQSGGFAIVKRRYPLSIVFSKVLSLLRSNHQKGVQTTKPAGSQKAASSGKRSKIGIFRRVRRVISGNLSKILPGSEMTFYAKKKTLEEV